MQKIHLFELLDLQKRKTIPLLYILLVSISILVFYYCYLNNKLSIINELNNNILKIENEILEIQPSYNNLQNIILKTNDIAVDLQELKEIVIDYFEPYKIINDLDYVINKNGLSVIGFNIAKPQKIEIESETEQYVYVAAISLKVSGNYKNIRDMIQEIQNEYSAYKVSTLRLNVSSGDTIELSLMLNSFSKELSKPAEEKSLEPGDIPLNKNPFDSSNKIWHSFSAVQ